MSLTLESPGDVDLKLSVSSKKAEGIVRVSSPFSKAVDGPIAYFEATILRGSVVAIGVCTESCDCKASAMLGQDKAAAASYGMHSIDSRVRPSKTRTVDVAAGESEDRAKGPRKASAGDVLGCGYVFATGTLFWTVNGQLRSCAEVPSKGYFGALSLSRSSAAEVNFGRSPFVFDVTTLPRDRVDLEYSTWLCKLRRLGNVMGLCLLHGGDQFELRSPLYFSRHVYKYIIGSKRKPTAQLAAMGRS